MSPKNRLQNVYLEKDLLAVSEVEELRKGLNFEPHYFVRATLLGPWPGTDIVDSLLRIRGELGAPHLSLLPELADRGYGATTLARTLACLSELHVDGAPFGWRLVSGAGREQQRAISMLSADINALADVVGHEKSAGNALKTQLVGPTTLAASVYLPNGELAISDAGSTRDLYLSLAEGLKSWLALVQEATPGEQVYVQFNEQQLEPAVRGSLRTASGLRTYPAVEPHVPEQAMQVLHETVKGFDGKIVVCGAPSSAYSATPLTGVAYDVTHFNAYDWERVAATIESGQQAWLGAVSAEVFEKAEVIARRLWESWRTVGLSASKLREVTLTETGELSNLSPGKATAVAAHLTEVARILSELAQDEG